MYITTFDNSQSIFLVENQLKTLLSVTRNGRINYISWIKNRHKVDFKDFSAFVWVDAPV